MNGLIVHYTLDPNYFQIGKAYQLHLGTNDYRVGVITKLSENQVTFIVFDEKGKSEELRFTSESLLHNTMDMIRLEPDYCKGKLKV